MGQDMLNVILVLSTFTATCSVGMIPEVPEFFQDVRADLSKVVWSHATNSKVLLETALNDNTMMIEADILMGTKPGSEEAVPIMAHPPEITSDLTAKEFIENVIHANKKDGKKKGIKLDFKQYEALMPVLKHLELREDDLTFPVWLNADVLQGPVNSTNTPLPAKQFVQECQKHLRDATLSLGWTTRFGLDSFKNSIDPNPTKISEGKYTQQQLNEMLDLVDMVDGGRITIPVRAGIAAQSRDTLAKLEAYQCTLTLWSPIDDPIDMLNLTRLIDNFGKSKTYIDLPFDLETGPQVVPDPTYDGLHRRGAKYSTSTCLTVSVLTSLLFLIALFFN